MVEIMTAYRWHFDGDTHRRGKIIERIEDIKKNAPETLEGKLTAYARNRAALERKRRISMGKNKKIRWENYQED